LTIGSKKREAPLTSLAAARQGFEKEYIVSVLERVEGSRTTASKILGLSRKALWEKCKRYGIPSAHGESREEEMD
jgi:two-component system response regulator HydG